MTVLIVSTLGLLAIGALYERLGEFLAKRRMPAPGRAIDIGGRRLHSYELGSEPGPTVIIEQGAGSPSLTWWPVQRRIAEFARVLSYDRAGYLWSDPAGRRPNIDDRVDDLHALLHASEAPSPYVFVTHSYGGLLSRRFIKRWPDEVCGLILVDAPPESVLFDPAFLRQCAQGARFQKILAAAAQVGLLRLCARWLPMLLLPDDPSAKALCVSPSFMTATAEDFASLAQAPATLRLREQAGELNNMPVFVLAHGIPFPGPAAGLEDGWTSGMESNATLSRNSRLVVAKNSNHMIHLDQPELVVNAVRSVLDAVRSGLPMH
jgi:pimeloyl-ACP methyl ester carboxylesterase